MYCFLHSGVMWADRCSVNFIFMNISGCFLSEENLALLENYQWIIASWKSPSINGCFSLLRDTHIFRENIAIFSNSRHRCSSLSLQAFFKVLRDAVRGGLAGWNSSGQRLSLPDIWGWGSGRHHCQRVTSRHVTSPQRMFSSSRCDRSCLLK